jgi:cysteine-rich repeat protein
MSTEVGRKGQYCISFNLCLALFAIGCVPIDELPNDNDNISDIHVDLDPIFGETSPFMDDGGPGGSLERPPEIGQPPSEFPGLPGEIIEPPESGEADPEEDPEALLLKECGDGVIQAQNGEQCDPGLNAGPQGEGCDNRCQVLTGYYCEGEPSNCYSKCGDGALANDELCDDGNDLDGDGCSVACELEEGFDCSNAPSFCVTICGDGLVRGSEQCDDANNLENDGCSSRCEIQDGFDCPNGGFSCVAQCGDGFVVGHETCDDLNLTDGDGCSSQCETESEYDCIDEPSTCRPNGHDWNVCGDGVLDPAELNLALAYCDDGNDIAGDGCNELCEVEDDFFCQGEPSVCISDFEIPVCGDGILDPNVPDACDDENNVPGDGCSDLCKIEEGFTCSGTPSVCISDFDPNVCGDGFVDPNQPGGCDDGNTMPGDGCSDLCETEAGFICQGEPSFCVDANV